MFVWLSTPCYRIELYHIITISLTWLEEQKQEGQVLEDGLDQQAVHPRSSGLQPRRAGAGHPVQLPAHNHRRIKWVSIDILALVLDQMTIAAGRN